MPRKAKGARLHWRERADGKSVWEIRDGDKRTSTGTADRPAAEAALAEYISRKYRPVGPVDPTELSVSMCLSIYAEAAYDRLEDPDRMLHAVTALDTFWRDLSVSAVKGETCRRYVVAREVADGTARRELGVLRSAINYCHKEGYLTSAPAVTLPPKPDPKERWLTRQEAAWLLRGARALHSDGRHLQDFILHALYTGSRKATILAMHFDTPSLSGGHVDTVNGILYRKPQGKRETNKRQRPARIPPRYLAHLRRQAKNGRRFVVERKMKKDGELVRMRVANIRSGWDHAVSLAMDLAAAKGIEVDLVGVTPHTLKHTAITWALQRGATIWDAAGYFSTSAATIERVYGHHCPTHQATAVEAMDRRA